MMYEQGLLQGNLNDVQKALLLSKIKRKQLQEHDKREEDFENDMLINNTELYKAWIDKKTQERVSEEDNIEWRSPQSLDEAAEVAAEFAAMEAKAKAMAGEDTSSMLNLLDDDDFKSLSD